MAGVEVQVEGLTKSSGRANIWSDVTLTLPPGEVSVLLGPSGRSRRRSTTSHRASRSWTASAASWSTCSSRWTGCRPSRRTSSTAAAPTSSPTFTGADVTYRGVGVGRVGPLRLTATGVDVELDIDRDAPGIPANVDAAVRNLSAIGEMYVDLSPAADTGTMLAAGSVIPTANTSVPVGVEDLVVNLDSFVRSVPLDSLRTVVDQLGVAFSGSAQPLQKLLDTTSRSRSRPRPRCRRPRRC